MILEQLVAAHPAQFIGLAIGVALLTIGSVKNHDGLMFASIAFFLFSLIGLMS